VCFVHVGVFCGEDNALAFSGVRVTFGVFRCFSIIQSSVYVSVCMPSVCISICLFVRLRACMAICLFVYPSVCLSDRLPTNLCV
jgi:hypothetical protein